MRSRLLHAFRFALTTLVAVYLVGLAWELLDVYLLGDAGPGTMGAGTAAFNEREWRLIAAVLALVVFLFHLSDVNAAPPAWGDAWASSALLAAATVATSTAVEQRAWRTGAAVVLASLISWGVLHRRIGERRARAGRGPRPERELR